MLKTATVTADPTIEFNFSGSVAPTVLGIINHNLHHDDIRTGKYTDFDIEHWNGSSYDIIGTGEFNGNRDIFVAWTSESPQTKWRITFNRAVVPGLNFQIGNIFWGNWRTLLTNPTNNGVIIRRTIPLVVEESAGGAKHVAHGAKKRSGTLEATFRRADIDDVGWWGTLHEDELLGILGPEVGDYMGAVATPVGDGIFWGYFNDITSSASGPGQSATSQEAKYDYTVFVEGSY